jgi:hypothetical protein
MAHRTGLRINAGMATAPDVKQQLAVRMMFDWLITGQIVPLNPARARSGESSAPARIPSVASRAIATRSASVALDASAPAGNECFQSSASIRETPVTGGSSLTAAHTRRPSRVVRAT